MRKNHPYEEIAYFLNAVDNVNQEYGSGMIGELDEPMEAITFLNHLKSSLDLKTIKYTETNKTQISRVAICGGSGSFLLGKALAKGADAFVTGDFKYHEFFDAEKRLMIADIGHYESEVYTKELICEYLSNKFSNFTFYNSEINTNPVRYI